MGRYLNVVMREMCKRVGADFKKINPKKEGWYLTYSWTIEQEEKFKEWFVDYLYKNTKARNEILAFPLKNKKHIERALSWFLLDYGWRIVDFETMVGMTSKDAEVYFGKGTFKHIKKSDYLKGITITMNEKGEGVVPARDWKNAWNDKRGRGVYPWEWD